MRFLLIIFLIVPFFAYTQDLNGIWRGTLTQEPGGCYPVYNLELQINSNNNIISGKSYDFYDATKYVKLNFSGRYNFQTHRMVLIESEILEHSIPKDCVPCIKTYDLTYTKNDKEESLSGNWKGQELNNKSVCPPGKITLKRVAESAFKVDVDQSPEMKKIQIGLTLQSRQNEVIKTIKVEKPSIKIELYDNAEVDGDTVTIFLNNKLLVYKKRLTDKPLTLQLNAFPGTDYELMMYADNLGSIPPNTALMVVTCGDKKHEVYLSSTEQKNAVVRFRYQ
jgi:hypothetical protein